MPDGADHDGSTHVSSVRSRTGSCRLSLLADRHIAVGRNQLSLVVAYEVENPTRSCRTSLAESALGSSGSVGSTAAARLGGLAGRLHLRSSIDWRLSSGFHRTVLNHLSTSRLQPTASYASVRAMGNPKAVRAVGTACATNPLPVVVPCHRVLRSDGTLGGYLGGVEAKRTLLGLEAAA
jgi:O-6-methylguanine DNA methyltransferase